MTTSKFTLKILITNL